MKEIHITMGENGLFENAEGAAGYVDEYCAEELVIELDGLFLDSVISYYTISFEPCGLGKKIVTENLYRDRSYNQGNVYFSEGELHCPLFDYITAYPSVKVQIDGYEVDDSGDIVSIYKSGMFTLKFSESVVGDACLAQSERTDLKLSERIEHAVDEKVQGSVFDSAHLADGAVTTEKISNLAVTQAKLADGSVTAGKLGNASVQNVHLTPGCVHETNLGQASVSGGKLANESITQEKLADGSVNADKLSGGSVTMPKLHPDVVGNLTMLISSRLESMSYANWTELYDGLKCAIRNAFDGFDDEVIDMVEETLRECDEAVASAARSDMCFFIWYLYHSFFSVLVDYNIQKLLEDYVRRTTVDNLETRVSSMQNTLNSLSNNYVTYTYLNNTISPLSLQVNNFANTYVAKTSYNEKVTSIEARLAALEGQGNG